MWLSFAVEEYFGSSFFVFFHYFRFSPDCKSDVSVSKEQSGSHVVGLQADLPYDQQDTIKRTFPPSTHFSRFFKNTLI